MPRRLTPKYQKRVPQAPTLDESGIEPTLEVLGKGYDLLAEQIRSLQNRCGVGLGVLVAASPGAVLRFLRIMPTFLECKRELTAYIFGGIGFVGLSVAIYFFLRGFFVDRLYLPYDKDDLTQNVWREGRFSTQFYRLSNLSAALDGLEEAAREKRDQLRNGIIFTILGVLLFLIIELLRYILDPMGVNLDGSS